MHEDLVRQWRDRELLDVPFAVKSVGLVKSADGDEEGVFEGLASTFGNTDLTGDVIESGAFKASLKNVKKIRLLWQHDAGQPIGVWEEMEETDKGLEVKGRLVLGVQQGREAYELLKAGALDSMSIGFRIPNPKRDVVWDEASQVRRIKRVDLWEVSLVTFPANPKARIQAVKALIETGDLPTERELERLLRDAGFSRNQAKAFIADGYAGLTQRDAGDDPEPLLEALQRNIANLK